MIFKLVLFGDFHSMSHLVSPTPCTNLSLYLPSQGRRKAFQVLKFKTKMFQKQELILMVCGGQLSQNYFTQFLKYNLYLKKNLHFLQVLLPLQVLLKGQWQFWSIGVLQLKLPIIVPSIILLASTKNCFFFVKQSHCETT